MSVTSADAAPRVRRIHQLLAEYGTSHTNKTNKAIHWIAVPVIVWTVVAVLWELPFPAIAGDALWANWAVIALAATLVYYVRLSLTLAAGMLAFTALCFAIIIGYERTPLFGLDLWVFALGVFVIAWIAQFIGHNIEGKRPSFLKDVQFLMIGPAWLMSFIYRRLGVPI